MRGNEMANYRKLFSVIFLIVMTINTAVAQTEQNVDLSGSWKGTLSVSGQQLPLVFHISNRDNSEYIATMDSPAQGATNIPIESVNIAIDVVTINVAVAQAKFSGRFDATQQTINGQWTQGSTSLPLVLKKVLNKETKIVFNRPQHPIAPFPYETQDITITTALDDVELAGTLTIPSTQGRYPAVILITGSGPQDRDQTFMGHKTFLVIADFLTRQGIAVFRYDDRGVGKSTGDFSTATSVDFAKDVVSAFDYLQNHENIDGARIGLIGHSEGGLIAPIAANMREEIAFISLLAGPGQTGNDISVWQIKRFLLANGLGQHTADAAGQITAALNQTVLKNDSPDTLDEELQAAYRDAWQSLSMSDKQSIKNIGGGTLSASRMEQLSSAWTKYFLAHDPIDFLKNLTIPVMAIHGDKDTQMSDRLNLSRIRKALQGGGHALNKVQKINGVNHLFQTAKTGLMSEYAQIEETISPSVLKMLSDWIIDVTNH